MWRARLSSGHRDDIGEVWRAGFREREGTDLEDACEGLPAVRGRVPAGKKDTQWWLPRAWGGGLKGLLPGSQIEREAEIFKLCSVL